jgi:MFS family permease
MSSKIERFWSVSLHELKVESTVRTLTRSCASASGYAIAQQSMVDTFHTPKIIVTLGITLFTIFFGSAPLLLAPISECYGRSGIYLASAIGFTLFYIPQALAQNIETMLVSRVFA